MAKDTLGNELQVGDYVEIHLAAPRIFGRVMSVSGGGIVSGLRRGGRERTLGQVQVTAQIPAVVDPETNSVPAIVKVADPEPEEGEKLRRMAGEAGSVKLM